MTNHRSVKIGYLGPDTCTFGYQALQKAFSDKSKIGRGRPNPVAFPSHQAICEAVGHMKIKYGVVAVENVIDGVVPETIRAVESVASHLGISICSEVTVPIELFYMSKTGKDGTPKRLLSHQKALGQCSGFVSSLQNDGMDVGAVSSTGAAAKVASENPEVAALASRIALEKYGLKLIHDEPVVDHRNSVTRFWVLAKNYGRPTGKDKTCFLVNLEQSAKGALHKSLGVFAAHGISVLIVYPSPILGKQWEYTFVIEVGGHVSDDNMVKAWNEFRDLGLSLQPMRFLGSYPDMTSVRA